MTVEGWFSPRERQVVKGIVAGQTNKEIAHEMGVAPGTVRKLRQNAVRKAGARNSAHLAAIVARAEA